MLCAGPGVGLGDPDGCLQDQHILWFLLFHLVQFLYFGLGLENGPGVAAAFVNLLP